HSLGGRVELNSIANIADSKFVASGPSWFSDHNTTRQRCFIDPSGQLCIRGAILCGSPRDAVTPRGKSCHPVHSRPSRSRLPPPYLPMRFNGTPSSLSDFSLWLSRAYFFLGKVNTRHYC